MQWYDDFNRQPVSETPEQPHGIRRYLAMSCLMPVAGVVLILGLCGLMALVLAPTASVIALLPAATRTPLPALTATPLPTLTPTVGPVQAAGGASSPSSAFSPSNAAPSNGSVAAQPVQPGGAGPISSSVYAPSGAAPANGGSVAQTNPAAGVSRPVQNTLPPTPASTPGKEVVIILPTVTPPTATPTKVKTPTPSAVATATPTTVAPAPGGDSEDGGDGSDPEEGSPNWSFTGVRSDTTLYQNGMLVYGNLVNHSATAQEVERVSATFFDAQGNQIGQGNHIQAYWPGYSVPPGGGMPFQLLVNGLNGAANFDLNLGASLSSSTPRDDFEFSGVKQSYQNNSYCVDGYLRNSGSQLQEYLIVTAVLYDQRDNVINFQDEQVYNPARVVGDQKYHFKICVAPPYDDAARYDLQAWGY